MKSLTRQEWISCGGYVYIIGYIIAIALIILGLLMVNDAFGAPMEKTTDQITFWNTQNVATDSAKWFCTIGFDRTEKEIFIVEVFNPLKIKNHFTIFLIGSNGKEISNSRDGQGWGLRDGFLYFQIPKKFKDQEIGLNMEMDGLYPIPEKIFLKPKKDTKKIYTVDLKKQ